MTKEEIKEFVQEWMNSHEQDTFIKNEHGVVLYSSGHTSLNLTCFFEDLLSDFIESENEMLKAESGYWKERCLLSEDCLEKSPCDPDITSEQIEAWQTYHRFIKEFGVLPPKQ